MKIKSITDIITNSSSESYIVKTTLGLEECKNRFIEVNMKMEEFGNNDYDCKETYLGDYTRGSFDIRRVSDDKVVFSWDILCNLEYAMESLVEVFGEDNVEWDVDY